MIQAELPIYTYLLLITNAAITPGTHPINVSIKTIINEPQPLSITAKGGKIMQRMTRPNDINISFQILNNESTKLQIHF